MPSNMFPWQRAAVPALTTILQSTQKTYQSLYWRTNPVALVNSNGTIATMRCRRNGSTPIPRCLECNKQCRVPERPRVTPRLSEAVLVEGRGLSFRFPL